MTAEVELPPLPERFDCTNGSAQLCYGCYTMTRDDLGDYVLAEDYDALRNASEALQAEIEALRAQVERLTFEMERLQQQYDERTACMIVHRGSALACSDAVRAAYSEEHERAERLAEALRRYRNEVPLGHQPHMLAHVVDDMLNHTAAQEGKESFWPKLPGSGGPDWTGHD